jgi:hypothetical protein
MPTDPAGRGSRWWLAPGRDSAQHRHPRRGTGRHHVVRESSLKTHLLGDRCPHGAEPQRGRGRLNLRLASLRGQVIAVMYSSAEIRMSPPPLSRAPGGSPIRFASPVPIRPGARAYKAQEPQHSALAPSVSRGRGSPAPLSRLSSESWEK